MKTHRSDRLIAALFCVFLGAVLLLFLLGHGEAFSEKEKRYLAEPPVLSWSSLLSGTFGEQAEAYAADHLPGRDFLVGLNAAYDLLSGRQVTKAIVRGRSGRLYEAPAAFDESVIRRNMAAVNDFAGTVGQPVDLLLIPSAGYMLSGDMPRIADPYADGEILDAASALAGDGVRPLDLRPVFTADAPETLYYRTDHHWTSRGAWLAAGFYAQSAGREAPDAERYTVTEVPGFYGTTWSRSALWATPAETLELWDSGGSFSVENAESEGVHEGLFYPAHLEEADKYPVFLDGNHSLVRVRRAGGEADGRLLVIRDSFSNSLGCFLADTWGEVVLVDLRYYREPVSALLERESFDSILVVYGVRNFMTDGGLVRLE